MYNIEIIYLNEKVGNVITDKLPEIGDILELESEENFTKIDIKISQIILPTNVKKSYRILCL